MKLKIMFLVEMILFTIGLAVFIKYLGYSTYFILGDINYGIGVKIILGTITGIVTVVGIIGIIKGIILIIATCKEIKSYNGKE